MSQSTPRVMDADGQRAAEESIAAALKIYLEWARTGEPDLWRRAFHAQASVVNASRGDESVAVWPIEEWVRRVEVLRERVGVVEESVRALHIDVARHVAMVRLDFNLRLGSDIYTGTDFFRFARLSDRWLITHKHYDGDRPL